MKAVTIHDVARAAGVSVGTVSKALNKTGTLSDATRARVIVAVGALKYRPNVLAKSLHSGLSGTVGLISNDSFGRFTMPIMEGLEGVLSAHGMGVFMCNATDDPEREREHLAQLMAKQIDGIVVTSRRADRRPAVELQGIGLPVIFVYSHSDDPEALTLLPDDEGGARLAVAELLAGGRKRIAHLTGPEHFEAVRLRQKGWADEAGDKAGAVLHGPWSEAWGRAGAAALMAQTAKPDAIFCGNDQIARGAADALREAGFAVPGDVALIGFDNWLVMAEAARPPLTSVDMNLCELGAEAGRRMAEMIRGTPMRGTVRLLCSLILREST